MDGEEIFASGGDAYNICRVRKWICSPRSHYPVSQPRYNKSGGLYFTAATTGNIIGTFFGFNAGDILMK